MDFLPLGRFPLDLWVGRPELGRAPLKLARARIDFRQIMPFSLSQVHAPQFALSGSYRLVRRKSKLAAR